MSVSGLSSHHVRQAVNLTLQAAVLGYHHAPAISYTQGDLRWQGIDRRRDASRGEYPNYADCSAYATWCYWNGLHLHTGHSDIVNGEHWQAGYTGTMLEHGRHVSRPIPGDAVIYGTSWPGEHVALYTGAGLVVSHGSEAGPFLLPWRYRSDVLEIRRYI
jgi:hypothetical protein